MSLCMVFVIPSAYNVVLSSLTHLELVRISRICHHSRVAVQHYQRAAFNINSYLSYFFDSSVLDFRNLQARTGTLVGKAAAFHFIERSPFPCNRIDLLVYPQYASDVAHWLLDRGYSFLPCRENAMEPDNVIVGLLSRDEGATFVDGICGTVVFEKASRQLTAHLSIANRSPMEIVLRSRNTLFFTMISWEKAYCIFPRASLHNRQVLLLVHDEDEGVHISDEDQATLRNFQVVQVLIQEGFNPNVFPLGWRWVNDSAALYIHLDLTGIEYRAEGAFALPGPMKSAMDYCGFQLSCDTRGSAYVRFAMLQSPSLQYAYTFCDPEMLFQVQRRLNNKEGNDGSGWYVHLKLNSGLIIQAALTKVPNIGWITTCHAYARALYRSYSLAIVRH